MDGTISGPYSIFTGTQAKKNIGTVQHFVTLCRPYFALDLSQKKGQHSVSAVSGPQHLVLSLFLFA